MGGRGSKGSGKSMALPEIATKRVPYGEFKEQWIVTIGVLTENRSIA